MEELKITSEEKILDLKNQISKIKDSSAANQEEFDRLE